MIDVDVLASGSRGNATLVRLHRDNMLVLIDAGLSPRRTKLALESRGLAYSALQHVILTHDDGDHLHTGWIRAMRSWSFVLHVHANHVNALQRRGVDTGRMVIMSHRHELSEHTHIEPHLVPHDDAGTAAFVLIHDGVRLGWATDLGHVEDTLISHFSDVDALAIESNYDRDMQLGSDRPAFLIDRIMGGRGHLSNRQAIDAIERIAAVASLQHIVLLHLSEQCNCPDVVAAKWKAIGTDWSRRMRIATQHQALERFTVTERAAAMSSG